MASPARISPHFSRNRIAIVVMKPAVSPALCAFFAKCDGVWTVDVGTGIVEFQENTQRTSAALCDLILAIGPGRLICGFIGENEKRRLTAAGIDIRLGSCACPLDDLVTGFEKLVAA